MTTTTRQLNPAIGPGSKPPTSTTCSDKDVRRSMNTGGMFFSLASMFLIIKADWALGPMNPWFALLLILIFMVVLFVLVAIVCAIIEDAVKDGTGNALVPGASNPAIRPNQPTSTKRSKVLFREAWIIFLCLASILLTIKANWDISTNPGFATILIPIAMFALVMLVVVVCFVIEDAIKDVTGNAPMPELSPQTNSTKHNDSPQPEQPADTITHPIGDPASPRSDAARHGARIFFKDFLRRCHNTWPDVCEQEMALFMKELGNSQASVLHGVLTSASEACATLEEICDTSRRGREVLAKAVDDAKSALGQPESDKVL